MRGRRRRLPWVFVTAVVATVGGLLVMHGIDGGHAAPHLPVAMASPAADAAGASAGPVGSTDPAALGAGIVPAWSSGAHRGVADADGPGSGIALGGAAMACVAVLITVAAPGGFAAALARAHPRVAGHFPLPAALRRAARTGWRPAAPATHERCVLIC